MLKYSIKLTDDNFKQDELVWGEKYLDPNLSFVSGVTDASNHLEKYDKINASNSLINSNAVVSVETENVRREGYVIIKGKKYNVYDGEYTDYSINNSGDTREFKYLFLNGKYYYADSLKVFHIDNWLVEDNGKVVESGVTSSKIDSSNTVILDTIYWIENETVTIDGAAYNYDKDRNGLWIDGINSGETLSPNQVTNCDGIEYHPYSSTTEYQEVTKFTLTKEDELSIPFDRTTYCKYFYYVMYKNHYCPIKKVINGNSYHFECEIPLYIYDPIRYNSINNGVSGFSLYFVSESSDGVLTENMKELSNEYVDEHGVYEITDLKNTIAYVIIDNSVYYVQNDIQNANDGKQIAIYLENETEVIGVGDVLRFKEMRNDTYESMVYVNGMYGFNENDSSFVMFANNKYYVEKNICDKVEINGNEYDIDYINGKIDGVDCLVIIGEDEVPFKLIKDGNTWKVQRYGRIVKKGSNESVIVDYPINEYDGVIINGIKYIVRNNGTYTYAELDNISRDYLFVVDDIKGSSLLVCSPYLSESDYTRDFINSLSTEMCREVVDNQISMSLYSKNKIFGEKEITKNLAFLNVTNPTSSDDYYNLFNDLVIYVRNGYINLPLQLATNIGNNTLQDDIVERDFFEREKTKAINPIVDMEKDVYYPKFIPSTAYTGSNTDFKPIRQINLNFHFRTRNNDNWKVNEGYNDRETSGKTDGWFITDYHPYKDLLSSNANTLQETSDLMGLLFFTNYDIYYQKSKVAKSFVRLSYYDSIDPQDQQLLATSTVFVDEHALFKKYIDNSRKNVNDYGIIIEPEYDSNGVEISSTKHGVLTTKVSVLTEFLGEKDKSRSTYEYSNTVVSALTEDNHRISSRLVINNKYETDTSSEGFYIHMFKEYSENLKPKLIYMKVEFNHAGVGKTIPFSIPMHWENKQSGYTYPTSAIGVNETKLKEGYPLSYVYAQSYVPLYAVYDFKNKEYAYVFDDRYFITSSKNKIYNDGVVNLNLFEMKIQNEDTEPTTTEQQIISRKQQVKADINFNESQFKIEGLTCN